MKTTGVSCETKFGLLDFLGHPIVNVINIMMMSVLRLNERVYSTLKQCWYHPQQDGIPDGQGLGICNDFSAWAIVDEERNVDHDDDNVILDNFYVDDGFDQQMIIKHCLHSCLPWWWWWFWSANDQQMISKWSVNDHDQQTLPAFGLARISSEAVTVQQPEVYFL